MQYQAQTPQAYLEELSQDWRKDTLLSLRQMIFEEIPTIEEVISYKMLGYRLQDDTVFHLNAQKAHVGLYVGDVKKVDPEGTLLAGLDMGKGCIRFKKSTRLPEENLRQFIRRTHELWQQGSDISC